MTQAGKDAYNQIVKDLDGYWDLSDQLIEEGSTTDQEISKKSRDVKQTNLDLHIR